MALFSLPDPIVRIMTRLEDAGFEAYLVGGCVRDMVMDRTPSDWDICANALPEAVLDLFPGALPTGLKHGTVTVKEDGGKAEVTTFRAEGDYSDHRHPDAVSFIPDIEGDLSRRDFTCNAMALPLSGELRDPFGGMADIALRLIRCVGEPELRYREDALRMFRALRFAGQLGFAVEPYTLFAIFDCAALAKVLPPERVADELGKLLLSPSPEFAAIAVNAGLLEPYLSPGPGPPKLLRLSAVPVEKACRWAGFCAALAAAGRIHDAESFLRKLRLDNNTLWDVARGLEVAAAGTGDTALSWKRAVADHGRSAARCAAAALLVTKGGEPFGTLDAVLGGGDCLDLRHLAVTGDDLKALGYSGPEIGAALQKLLHQVLERPEDNVRELLLGALGKKAL